VIIQSRKALYSYWGSEVKAINWGVALKTLRIHWQKTLALFASWYDNGKHKHTSMKYKFLQRITYSLVLGLGLVFGAVPQATAQSNATNPKQGTTGMQGTIPSPPPTTAATINNPANGRTFTSTPIDIGGLCTTDLLVKVFSNNIFIGSAQCIRGSYGIKADLFSGDNTLVARVYDALDQTGPDSNIVTVNFQDNSLAAFGQRISLSSSMAKNGANIGDTLTWPIILSGGSAPYAISVDWGDGSAAELISLSFAGPFDIRHKYKTAGVYRVIVKGSDSSGAAAFLQLVGVGNGAVTQGSASGAAGGASTSSKVYVWWPVLLLIPFAIAAFWIGRKFELVAIHRRLEKQASLYQNEIQR
jgi:hypothetical protein